MILIDRSWILFASTSFLELPCCVCLVPDLSVANAAIRGKPEMISSRVIRDEMLYFG